MATPDDPQVLLQRSLGWLKATTADGRVRLSFLKTTPFFSATQSEENDSTTIQVWRLALPAYCFNNDYEEFFDGLRCEDADLVFTGPLPATNRRKYEFLDETGEIGIAYAYWVGSERSVLPTGPAFVKLRDPRVWWTWEEIRRRTAALADELAGQVEQKPVGRTVHGRELTALLAGRRDRALVIIGSVHGGEAGAELALPAFEHIVRNHRDLLEQVGLAVLPCLNADERDRLARGYPPYLRTNASGVDLNRNFPEAWEQVDYSYGLVTSDPECMTYRGPGPASEPETAAAMALLRTVTPAALLAFHHLASITGSSFLYSKAAAGDEVFEARCRALNGVYRAAAEAEGVAETPVVAVPGCTAGSLPAWAYATFGAPAFDVEGDRSEICVRAITDTATFADLQAAQDYHRRGIVALLGALATAQ